MELKTLERLVQEFCEARDWDQFHNPKELAIGVITEASELLENFRFLSDEQCQSLMRDSNKSENVRQELADVLFFLLRFAQMNKIDLAQALQEKIKLNNEKYPVAASKGKNLKYTDL